MAVYWISFRRPPTPRGRESRGDKAVMANANEPQVLVAPGTFFKSIRTYCGNHYRGKLSVRKLMVKSIGSGGYFERYNITT